MAPPLPAIPSPGTPTKKQSFAESVITYLQYLSGIGGLPDSVINGNFEVYTGSTPNVPDNWEFTAYAGSMIVDTTHSADGSNSVNIVVPGSGGGGYLQSAILLPWNPETDFWASWFYYATYSTIANRVDVVWFDADQSEIEVQNLWQADSGQPTSWVQNVGMIPAYDGVSGSTVIPSNAKFYALRFTGGTTINTQAGNVLYDRVISGFQPSLKGITVVYSSGSGNFIPPIDCFRIKCRLWGGGANGTGTDGSVTAGGGGGYSEGYLSVVPGVAVPYVVGGVAGNSSVTNGSTTFYANGASGNTGGTASGGNLNISGQAGYTGDQTIPVPGGSSPLGGGGGYSSSIDGVVPGGGGGADGTVGAGSNGAHGLVIITY